MSILQAVSLSLILGTAAYAQNRAPTAPRTESGATTRATGTFDVKIDPLTVSDTSLNAVLGRMAIEKDFTGDLEGTSKGEMLTGVTAIKNSTGYVAVERVSGTLHGKTGTFILQHSGTMTRGITVLSVTVVPDSGTGQLVGLTGSMSIAITSDGRHSYQFDYSLPK
jgi:hypothetical protein